jgi:O-antigen/teichoic acid export membrane protein
MASRPGWHTAMLVAIVALALAGNALLVPRVGLVGAASATALAAVAAALLVRTMARAKAAVLL